MSLNLEQGPQLVNCDKLSRQTKKEKRDFAKREIECNKEIVRNRRRYDVVETFPDRSFERLETNQIWMSVLSQLKEQSDITSAYFTCTAFQRYLEERRKRNLLPEVLKILRERRYLTTERFSQLKTEFINEQWESIMNLRIASVGDTFWRETVDQQFFEHSFTHYSNPRWSLYRPQFIISNIKDIDSATDVLKNASGYSLFRGLSLRGEFGGGSTCQAYFEKLLAFLDSYGHEIWGLVTDGQKFMFNYEKMRMLIMRMPNLKILFFALPCFHLSSEQKATFRQKLIDNPFPTLKSLEVFEYTSRMREVEEYLPVEVVSRCTNLKSFKFLSSKSRNDDSVIRALGSVPNLEYIQVNSFSGDVYFQVFNDLERLNGKVWPLKSLNLRLNHSRSSVIRDMFSIANTFGETLQELNVSFINENDIERNNIVLHLPHLKSITLIFWGIGRAIISLEDIATLRNLERLEVNMESFMNGYRGLASMFKYFPRLSEVWTEVVRDGPPGDLYFKKVQHKIMFPKPQIIT